MGEVITVNNRPLREYLHKAEALERQVEAEQVRLEEIRQHKRYAPIVTKRLLLWLPKKKREQVDPREYEKLVRQVREAIKAPAGLTYAALAKVVGGKWQQKMLAQVVKELGAARWRQGMQGPVVIGMVLPEGRKLVGGGQRRKMATQEQLEAARAKEAGVMPPLAVPTAPPQPTPVVPMMGTLRRELVDLAAMQAAFWLELKERLIREAPKK